MLHSGQAGSVRPSELAVASPSSEVWTVLLLCTSLDTLKCTHVIVHKLCTVNILLASMTRWQCTTILIIG